MDPGSMRPPTMRRGVGGLQEAPTLVLQGIIASGIVWETSTAVKTLLR